MAHFGEFPSFMIFQASPVFCSPAWSPNLGRDLSKPELLRSYVGVETQWIKSWSLDPPFSYPHIHTAGRTEYQVHGELAVQYSGLC